MRGGAEFLAIIASTSLLVRAAHELRRGFTTSTTALPAYNIIEKAHIERFFTPPYNNDFCYEKRVMMAY